MKKNLSIIIAHYNPNKDDFINPIFETLDIIENQLEGFNIEVIIADDGSYYSQDIINNYSKKESISDDDRYFYTYSFKITDHYLHVHFPQFIMNSKPTFEELKEYINTPIHWLFYSYPNYILSSDRIFNKIINPLIIPYNS